MSAKPAKSKYSRRKPGVSGRDETGGTAAKKPSRARDVAGILCVTLAAMIAISLLSYSALDYPKGSRTGADVANLLGPFGAAIAFYLSEFAFGRYITLILPLLLLYLGIDLLRGHGFRLLRRQLLPLASGAVLAVTMWSWIREYDALAEAAELTGLVGIGLRSVLTSYLGITGAALLLAALALIYVTVLLRIRWSEFFAALASGLATIPRFVKSRPRVAKEKKSRRGKGKVEPEPSAAPAAEPRDTNPPRDAGEPEIVASARFSAPARRPRSSSRNGNAAAAEAYQCPEPDLLESPPAPIEPEWDERVLRQRARNLEQTLREYGVEATVVAIHPGPVITRYDLKPARGVKVNRISNLADDLALSLSAVAVRIIAPIPGAGAVGIEVPNDEAIIVYLREIVESHAFVDAKSPLAVALGKTARGEELVVDLATMPHLLIAGTTGSGKSVCINSIIASLLMRNRPDEVQFVMIDPKKIELSMYGELRRHHLLYLEAIEEMIATEPKNAVALLQSAVLEMERRYDLLAETGTRNLREFNRIARRREEEARAKAAGRDEDNGEPEQEEIHPLPHLVLIIDELADLMMIAARDVEEPIARLAQMARAVGIHLIVATQRPSVDVITGVIKANFPARIAFMVATRIDSRTILDRGGAEKLLGNGDGLFLSNVSPQPVRFHGAYISTEEVHRLIAHVRRQPAFVRQVELVSPDDSSGGNGGRELEDERDPLFDEAVRLVARHQQGSVSLLQRRLKIGYARAGRLLDQLEMAGVVGPFEGSKARDVYIQPDDVDEFLGGE
ncbi:MAG: DNA translocase SpoIIIE [Calditrichaeota bacterium]|nr:DNA translocase SpoIIIE [Calditrichota bacterium]